MFLTQATQAAIVVEVGELRLRVPKFTTDDWADWAAELDADRKKDATAGIDPVMRFRLLNAYGFLPTTLDELRDMIRTPGGIRRVVKICLSRASVIKGEGQQPLPLPPEDAERIYQNTDHASKSRFAVALADLQDTSRIVPAASAAASPAITPPVDSDASFADEAPNPLAKPANAA